MNFKFQTCPRMYLSGGSNFKLFIIIICFAFGFLSPVNASAVEEAKKFKVVIAVKPLGLNHVIEEGDVKVILREAKGDRDITDVNDAVGKRVRRPVGENNIIKRDYLEEGVSVTVKKGDTVILIAERDNVRVSTKGRLKEDGGIGGIVRVENISSGKILSGRIVEPGIVKVDF